VQVSHTEHGQNQRKISWDLWNSPTKVLWDVRNGLVLWAI